MGQARESQQRIASLLADLPLNEQVEVWQELSLRLSQAVWDAPERVIPAQPDARTVDERIEAAHAQVRDLERAAQLFQAVARVAESGLHLIAAAHHDAVRDRDQLELAALGEAPTYGSVTAEFACDSLALALGLSSASADVMARDGRRAREVLPELTQDALRGQGRIASIAAAAAELDHLDADQVARVQPLLHRAGIHRVRPQTAREKTRRILRGLGLECPVDECEARRECGVWVAPHLDVDGLSEIRVVLETAAAARLRAVIEERAQQLYERAPDARDGVGAIGRIREIHTGARSSGRAGLPGCREYLGALRADALVDLVLSNAHVSTVLHLRVPVLPPAGREQTQRVNWPPLGGGMSIGRGGGTGDDRVGGGIQCALDARDGYAESRTGVSSCVLDARRDECAASDRAGVPVRSGAAAGLDAVADFGSVAVPGVGVIPAQTVQTLIRTVGAAFTVELVDGSWVTKATRTHTYRPTAGIARLVRDRDVHCRFPFCTKAAQVCDIDHVIPYADGGATVAANLQLLCRHHHRAKTHGGFTVMMASDGECTWESPTGQRWVTTPAGATYRTDPVTRGLTVTDDGRLAVAS